MSLPANNIKVALINNDDNCVVKLFHREAADIAKDGTEYYRGIVAHRNGFNIPFFITV